MIKRLFKKKVNITVGATLPVGVSISFPQIYSYFKTSHHVRAIHTLFAGATNRLNFTVYRGNHVDVAATAVINSYAGLIFADWFVLGRAVMNDTFLRMPPDSDDDELVVISNPNVPLESAGDLLFKIQELERAQKQAFYLAGAHVFAIPANTNLVATPAEIEAARKVLQQSIRNAGVGGIEVLPTAIEFKQISNKLSDFGFERLSIQLLRELCNLFGIDSSLLNDPENKTYSNKTEAQRAFYTNTIIPQTALFLQNTMRAIWLKGDLDVKITYDTSSIESIAEQQHKHTEKVLLLLQHNLITTEEARQMLELTE